MNDDLISRQDAIEAIKKSTEKYNYFMGMENYTEEDAIEAVMSVPTILSVSNTDKCTRLNCPMQASVVHRMLIRKLINNLYSESQYINTMMELTDRKNPDSAVALSQEELREIVILLSQTEFLQDYLKEHGILKKNDERR